VLSFLTGVLMLQPDELGVPAMLGTWLVAAVAVLCCVDVNAVIIYGLHQVQSMLRKRLTRAAAAAAAAAAGNPEEGELRPQLLDRFGMHAQIGTVKDPELRVQIVSERSTFDENPAEFHKKYAEKQVRAGLGA
jgi:hypothetical protein